jgi:mitofilin
VLQVEALHKAFYAQSEEAKVSHTTNKLALGALALEDAIIQGAPVGKEVELLMQAAGGFGIDEVVDMAVISLPEDAFKEGTWTHNQLQEKASSLQHFDILTAP